MDSIYLLYHYSYHYTLLICATTSVLWSQTAATIQTHHYHRNEHQYTQIPRTNEPEPSPPLAEAEPATPAPAYWPTALLAVQHPRSAVRWIYRGSVFINIYLVM